MSKKIIGDPLIINGRKLSLSKAVRAGDFVYLTGQFTMKNGVVITEGSIAEQTRIVLDEVKNTLIEAGCELQDVIKAMVWLKNKEDFPGFNSIYGEYFDHDPPARSAVVSDLLVDVLVEVEVVAYKPEL